MRGRTVLDLSEHSFQIASRVIKIDQLPERTKVTQVPFVDGTFLLRGKIVINQEGQVARPVDVDSGGHGTYSITPEEGADPYWLLELSGNRKALATPVSKGDGDKLCSLQY